MLKRLDMVEEVPTQNLGHRLDGTWRREKHAQVSVESLSVLNHGGHYLGDLFDHIS